MNDKPNGAMDRNPYRLALCLLTQAALQPSGIGHRGRSAKKYDSLFLDTNITH